MRLFPMVRRSAVLFVAALLWSGSAFANAPQPKVFHAVFPAENLTGNGSPDGDNYSFHNQIGAIIDGILKCFSVHMAGMDDNTVLFDGLSELLDPYVNGTQPLVFEFETTGTEGLGGSTTEIFSFADGDLFPEGFEDPETGTPLDSACIEIGIDDTLDYDKPVSVTSAMIDFVGDGFDPFDITSSFSDPWDGRLSFGIPGFAGLGIEEVQLQITTGQSPNIFADGFESGDASAWQ